MALRFDELAKTIDLTLLDPEGTDADVERLCEEATEHHLASVCVRPGQVAVASTHLRGRDVKVCAVVGGVDGAADTRTKVAAAEAALRDGAAELEVVLNVPAMLCGDFRLVRDEARALVRSVRLHAVNLGRGFVLLKAVLQTGHLDDKRKQLACRIVEDAGWDYAVTSTGADGQAAVHDVELLRECLSENVGVKAAGGAASAADVETLLGAGAGRIGVLDYAGLARAAVGEPV